MAILSQICGSINALLSTGVGFTTTDTFSVFMQLAEDNVYIYTTEMGLAVLLMSASLTEPTPIAARFRMPLIYALDQVKDMPGMLPAGVYLNMLLSHIAGGVSVLESIGSGFTVTLKIAVLLPDV